MEHAVCILSRCQKGRDEKLPFERLHGKKPSPEFVPVREKVLIEARSVVVIILNKESTIWKDASIKTLLRGGKLKYIDVEGMRVVTNNRCVAEQIKSDKVENVATGEVKRRECGKFG